MSDVQLTRASDALTRLVLTMFRANGVLNAAGNRLVADQGLTGARWQVLGAIVLADRPLTVAQIARRMGLTRQSVHASIRRLTDDGLLAFAPNADHRRSPLVELTAAGAAAYSEANRQQIAWANQLGATIPTADLATAEHVIDTLCRQLDGEESTDADSWRRRVSVLHNAFRSL
ncbi:MarR family winged helix-turn-helix transcriptional regulator [Nocardia sp. CA-151230]|uniref:MarR family winged helix-turn-helix transcriptional regulator n=1 Tax=Nocardia sp. CA-151230 TaxID=3239982 RepID=UPI003D8A1769